MHAVCHPINSHIPRPPRERSMLKWLHLHSVGLKIGDGAGGEVKLRVSRVDHADSWSLKLLCSSDALGASALIDAAAPSRIGSCNIVPRALAVIDGYQAGVLLEFEHDTPADIVRAG